MVHHKSRLCIDDGVACARRQSTLMSAFPVSAQHLTVLQAKLHYLKVVCDLRSFGGMYFHGTMVVSNPAGLVAIVDVSYIRICCMVCLEP